MRFHQLVLVPAVGALLPIPVTINPPFADAPGRPRVRLGGPKPEPREPRQPRRLKLERSALPKSLPALPQAPEQIAAPTGVTAVPVWVPLGPAPIPNGQTEPADDNGISQTQAPVSGRTIQIVVDPADPNIVYVGTAQGGLYRSLDGGTNWTPLMDNALCLAIGSMQLDPSDSTTLLVGTGEANFSGDSFAGVGVYKITGVKGASPTLHGPYNQEAVTGNDISKRRGMSGLAIDPLNHNTVYIGTSTGQQGIGPQPPTPGTAPNRGLYRSTNFFTGSPPTFTKIPVLGGNEPAVPDYRIRSIAYEPGNSNRMFVSVPDNNTSTSVPPYFGGVYYTADASAPSPTFTKVIANQPGTFSPAEIAIRKIGNTVTVAIVTGDPDASATYTGRLFTSTYDATTLVGAPTFAEKTAAQGFAAAQGSYNLAVDIDPTNANNIYICGTKNYDANDPDGCFFYTRDGGASFEGSTDTLHVDNHAVAVAPSNPNVIYQGNDGGIWKTTSGTANPPLWTDLNNFQFSATQFQSIAVHPIDRNFSIGGTQDNGTEFLRSNGTWRRADFGDGGYAVIDQTATNAQNVTMYHTYYNAKTVLVGFSRVKLASCATEGQWALRGGAVGILPGLPIPLPIGPVCDGSQGQTLNGLNLADDMNFYAPMALGPAVAGSTGQTVYFGTDRLYRSINQGDNMTVVSQSPLVPGGVVPDPENAPPGVPSTAQTNTPVSAIGISPTNDAVRIVGMNNGHVFFTNAGTAAAGVMLDITDLTQMPALGSNAFPPNTPGKYIARAVIDPSNPNTAYVVYNGNAILGKHIWKANLSSLPVPTWTAIDGSGATGIPDISVNAFVVDPRNSQHLYAGTDRGVYNSTDGGATWALYGSGLPNVQVFDLAIQDPFRILRAATHGRGFYEIPTAHHVQAISAVSRKTHGATPFDIPLPVSGTTVVTSAIECRSGGASNAHKIVVNFAVPVTFTGATVSSGTVSGTSGSGTDTVTVDLSGISNAQTISITLLGVNDGSVTGNVAVQMGVLLGDVNGNGLVNATDTSLVQGQSGAALNNSNFRRDVNANGLINATDTSIVQSKSGTGLP